jgi:hypothetical protein
MQGGLHSEEDHEHGADDEDDGGGWMMREWMRVLVRCTTWTRLPRGDGVPSEVRVQPAVVLRVC